MSVYIKLSKKSFRSKALKQISFSFKLFKILSDFLPLLLFPLSQITPSIIAIFITLDGVAVSFIKRMAS